MSRTTIDFGIDLGTTYSAIAVYDGVAARIIKNNDDQDVTPSAVFINKQGVLRVGSRAKSAIVGERTHEDAYGEFKRQMGTPHLYRFASSNQMRKPEELSAEVLKDLRAAAEARTGESIQSAVITVPAAFELHQCDATRRAATISGMVSSPLVQEPVAAALAYGFQIDSERAYWLVYDFGDGTFDAALIKAEEGMINVVHHGSDNFLGGSDIDWAVVEKLIIPQLAGNYDLPGFGRGSERWGLELRRIKHAVEAAKIELSTKEKTTLSGGVIFEDASGSTVDCDELVLRRDDVLGIAKPIIVRSIEICRRVLKEKNLGPQAVQKVIVVGGPTKAPYFREMLSDGLRIPIDFSQDPLTVVARGAAVFAGTQKVDSRLQKKAVVGEFQIIISDKYKTGGYNTEPLIAGKVVNPDGASTEGLMIEYVNRDSRWRSGQIPLNADGAFMADLRAEKGCRNTFHIEIKDRWGNQHKAVPDHVVYTVGAVIVEQPLLKSIGLAKADNTVDVFFKAGAVLPQKRRSQNPYRTEIALVPGQHGTALRLALVEGESPRADRNRLIGTLDIDASMVRRALPAGSEVEITLKISESRTLVLEAYFPALDEEFTKQIAIEKAEADPAQISKTLRAEKARLKEIKETAEKSGEDEVVEELEEIEANTELDEAVWVAKCDPAAAEKAQARLLELQLKLDSAEERILWPIRVVDVLLIRRDLHDLVAIRNRGNQVKAFRTWSERVERCIARNERERIPRIIEDGRTLFRRLLRDADP